MNLPFDNTSFESIMSQIKQDRNGGVRKYMADNKEEIINKAMEEATKIFGVDPAYFGKEGEEEVDRQLKKMGYSLEYLKQN